MFRIWKAACDFPTDYSNCRIDCWAKPGLASCVSEDFKSSWCCDTWNTNCMKRFKYCSLGLTKNDYKHFTCPASSCPKNNEPLVVYHSELNKERIDEITWDWNYDKIGFNCRV